MDNQKVCQLADDIVKEEIRKGNLAESKEALAMLPEILTAVKLDRQELRRSVEQCLTAKNPLNSLLNLFGVQLIKKEKAINSLLDTEQSNASAGGDKEYDIRWLTLDAHEMKASVEKMAKMLAERENQTNQDFDDEKKKSSELFGKYEKLLKEYNALKYSTETSERLVAERIQYILSVGGESAEGNEQLIELLRDMSIEVYWNCDSTALGDAAMFTEYAVDDKSMVSIKPCLVRNGAVYVKGIRLIEK